MSKSEPIATVQVYVRSDGAYGALIAGEAQSRRTDGWATVSACLDHVARLLAEGRERPSLVPCLTEKAWRTE